MTGQCWIALTDEVIRQVSGNICLTEDQLAEVDDMLAVATEVLGRLTGGRIHGPGIATDEFLVAAGGVRKLAPTFHPVTEVLGLTVDGRTSGFHTAGRLIFPRLRGKCGDVVRLQYRFGSTVTRGARSTAIYYARQLYLGGEYGDVELCQLPERVTSITREGISMSMLDPQTFLDKGLTGLIKVDEWLASYAVGNIRMRASVHTNDSPPPTNVEVSCIP